MPPPIIGDAIAPPIKPLNVSDNISSGLPSATALIAPSAAPDNEPSTIISAPYAANLPIVVFSVASAPSFRTYSLPCLAKIFVSRPFPVCSTVSWTTSWIISLPAHFVACSRPSLAVLSSALNPNAFATPVPAAPPKPFVSGDIAPFTKPVAKS